MKNLRFILSLALATLLLSGCETLTPEAQLLESPWVLKYDSSRVGLREGWFDNDHDRSQWEETAVPGVWADENYDGFAWYATQIQAKNIPAGYNLALVFDSIDDNAVVWLDGRLFGKQMGYNIKFFFDIGDKLADGKVHQLVLRIEDIAGPGGIPGAVYLEPYIDEVDLLRNEASKHKAPESPEWVKNATIYEVFVRQQSREGTFQGLIKDLDRIKTLGIDLLWLMPVHPIGLENRKGTVGSPYSVKDYYAVNPDMGSMEDFKQLVDEVHARGMHIILDFVLNHTAWDNELMDEHPDWYTQDATGKIIPPNADWHDVADLNYDNPELRNYLIEMLQWWITETDIDGFRFDVAELVPNDFWANAKAACQQVKPDVFFLAEGAAPELHLNGHDMTYSWNMWEGVIQLSQGNADPSEIKRSYELEEFQYPQGSLRMRFSENHDKTRSATLIPDRDLNLTAWAFIALMDGNPLIYAGQEIGTTGEYVPALFEKKPLKWKNGDTKIFQVMSDVLAIRKEHLKSSSPFKFIIANNDKKVLAYKHGELLNFFNFSADTFKFSASGMDNIIYGGIVENPDSSLSLLPKQFGVIK
ncbi:MAG: alpha-galactosidase [Candidatus Marinimicrobia bacterium]|nr:alpha-galactosidase [Candidatus Neomarinimicrobiota bacterium]